MPQLKLIHLYVFSRYRVHETNFPLQSSHKQDRLQRRERGTRSAALARESVYTCRTHTEAMRLCAVHTITDVADWKMHLAGKDATNR